MTGLRLTDSGWYWCSVGDLQVPVQLTVTKPKRTFTTIPTSATPSETDMCTPQPAANRNPTKAEITGSKPDTHLSDVILVTCLITTLMLLMLVTLVGIAFRLKKKPERIQIREEHFKSTRHTMPCENQMTSNRPADANSSASVDEGSVIYSSVITFHKAIYSKAEDPVIYSTINDEIPNDPSKNITTYSTIDHVPGSEAFILVDNLVDPSKVPFLTVTEPKPAPDVSVVSSSVSGHEGGDISVQCLYSSGYQNKLKRWCRYKDQSCYTVGRNDTSQNSSVQISDDGRRSFTVLMTGLRLTDSGWYFCSAGEALNPVQLTVIKA
ncbi:polymeric immunoglobulin receptor-like protein [Labeo rohita]|nr:polymeric immunoglobulin receptor-like protein [Labeo rohita]